VARFVGAAVLTLLGLVGIAAAQAPDAAVAEALHVQWERMAERAAIEGYVYNDSDYRIGLVRLRVATRQEGQAPTDSLAWVYGNVPARGRWYFRVSVPRTREVLGVTIESFSLIARDAPAQSP